MSVRGETGLDTPRAERSLQGALLPVVAHVSTRLLIMTLLAGTALLLVAWINWQDSYSRGMSVFALWVPLALVVWLLCPLSLLAAGRGIWALTLFFLLPVVGVVFAAVFLSLRSEGEVGLVGVIILLVAFDAAMLRVVHEVWKEIEEVR